jgi:MFS transporter, VNT family, synaptic vesicle glycoprotein 2
LTLNQEWSFHIDFLGIDYKPWRFFLLLCGVPNIICALVLYFAIPESPKFVFTQGDEEKTLKIFQKIFTINTGKPAELYEVKSITKDEEYNMNSQGKSKSFFTFLWSQTKPFFHKTHLKNILTACFIQFSVCNTSNGFWTFLPGL